MHTALARLSESTALVMTRSAKLKETSSLSPDMYLTEAHPGPRRAATRNSLQQLHNVALQAQYLLWVADDGGFVGLAVAAVGLGAAEVGLGASVVEISTGAAVDCCLNTGRLLTFVAEAAKASSTKMSSSSNTSDSRMMVYLLNCTVIEPVTEA